MEYNDACFSISNKANEIPKTITSNLSDHIGVMNNKIRTMLGELNNLQWDLVALEEAVRKELRE